jgi:tRNA threonylcarbamoyladenosine biosynthesis protein TsaB
MALLLSIDTATKVCSVALHENEQLLASQHLHIDKSHSGLLTVLVENVLQYAGFSRHDLTAVAISEGPGSYTGLRIGASTAKGLCFALDLPLIAVNTLQAMAQGMRKYAEEESLLCPMIDARRMEVYCLLETKAGEAVQKPQARIIEETSFSAELEKQKMYFFGDGAEKCEPLLGKNANARFIPGVVPSAVHVGELAMAKLQREDFADVAYFEPFYLKEFHSPKPKRK